MKYIRDPEAPGRSGTLGRNLDPRIFRGCIQIQGQPSKEDALNNWRVLQDAALRTGEESAALVKFLGDYFHEMSAPPDYSLMKEYFERSDNIAVVSYLEDVLRAQLYIRQNFRHVCKIEREQETRIAILQQLKANAKN